MKHYSLYTSSKDDSNNNKFQKVFISHNFDKGRDVDTYTERDNINQFLRDGAVINSLYDLTLQNLYDNIIEDIDDTSLEIFNKAYKICWMITAKEASYSAILSEVFHNRPNYLVRDLSQYIAWSILKVYDEFYEVDDSILETLRKRTQQKDMFPAYRELVRMQDDPSAPICFSTPGVRMPSPCPFFIDETEDDSFRHVLNFLGNQNLSDKLEYEEDEETSEVELTPTDDILDHSFSAIRSTYNGIKCENDRLAHALMDMETNHKKTIEEKDSTIARLRTQNNVLTRQLAEKETKVEVKEVVKKVVVKEPDPMSKILNWDSITDYALGLGNVKDVQAIYTMLNRISSRGRYFDDGLEKNLQKLEAYIRELQKPVINQTNQGCQQFYGEVKDSEFKTSKPNE